MTVYAPDCPADRTQYGRPCEGPATYYCDDSCRRMFERMDRGEESPAEALARRFHEAYERLAPSYSYTTRKDSAKPWREVPTRNRRLMIAVAQELIDTGTTTQP